MSEMRRNEADKSSVIFWMMGIESSDLKRIVWWHFHNSQDHNLNSVLFSAEVTAHFHNGHLGDSTSVVKNRKNNGEKIDLLSDIRMT